MFPSDECCYGEHEDFDIMLVCEDDECGHTRGPITITWCGQVPPARRCPECGSDYEIRTLVG